MAGPKRPPLWVPSAGIDSWVPVSKQELLAASPSINRADHQEGTPAIRLCRVDSVPKGRYRCTEWGIRWSSVTSESATVPALPRYVDVLSRHSKRH